MTQNLALDIYESIQKSSFSSLRDDVLRKTVSYSHFRANWKLADQQTRIEMDIPRTIAHNALIDSINILARNMHQKNESVEWYKYLKNNRIEVAELACWINCFLSLGA